MSSAIFLWFRKYPKLYVKGCPRAIFLSRSDNPPLFVTYYQKIIENNLLLGVDGRARPMRLLLHRMSLPTGKAPIDPPPLSRGSQKIQPAEHRNRRRAINKNLNLSSSTPFGLFTFF